MTYEHAVEVLKDQVQIAALLFMTTMYGIKIWKLMKLKPIVDRTPNRGDPDAGMWYSYSLIAMPWQMNSYRQHPMKYVEFAIFHLAVAAAITSTFIIPYFPGVMAVSAITVPCLIVIAGGFLCGMVRLFRRIAVTEMRVISTPDDYFAVTLLNAYLLSAFLSLNSFLRLPVDAAGLHWTTVLFFAMTTFFLIYVPFSKISHYVMWPFARYYIGKHFGKRGVYPKHRGTLRPHSA